MLKNQIETVKYLNLIQSEKRQDHLILDVPQSFSPFLGMQVLQTWLETGQGAACLVVPRPHLVPEMIDVASHMGVEAISAEQASPILGHGQVFVASLRAAIRNMQYAGCLVLHDAEQCAQELVNLFSLSVPSYAYLYHELRQLFGSTWQAPAGHTWDVPPEKWFEIAGPVKRLIREYEDSRAFAERLHFLDDIFDTCRCSFSESAITISAAKIPRRKLGVFASAPQRVFLAHPGVDRTLLTDVFDIQE